MGSLLSKRLQKGKLIVHLLKSFLRFDMFTSSWV